MLVFLRKQLLTGSMSFSFPLISLIFYLFFPILRFSLSFLLPSITLHHLDPPFFPLPIALCLPADSSLSESRPIRGRLHSVEKDDVISFSAGGQDWHYNTTQIRWFTRCRLFSRQTASVTLKCRYSVYHLSCLHPRYFSLTLITRQKFVKTGLYQLEFCSV